MSNVMGTIESAHCKGTDTAVHSYLHRSRSGFYLVDTENKRCTTHLWISGFLSRNNTIMRLQNAQIFL